MPRNATYSMKKDEEAQNDFVAYFVVVRADPCRNDGRTPNELPRQQRSDVTP